MSLSRSGVITDCQIGTIDLKTFIEIYPGHSIGGASSEWPSAISAERSKCEIALRKRLLSVFTGGWPALRFWLEL